MTDLDELLRGSDPLHADLGRAAEQSVLVARGAMIAPPPPRRRRVARTIGLGLALAVVVPTGGYVIADVVGAHTGTQATPNEYTADRSEVIDVCAKNFRTVILEYTPKDRALPASLTWSDIAEGLADEMTEGCGVTVGEPQTARSLAENYEFSADDAWKLAWLNAVQRHDRAAAEAAIAQVDATSDRPLVKVVVAEHQGTFRYNDRVIAAMRAGNLADAGIDENWRTNPNAPAWYRKVR